MRQSFTALLIAAAMAAPQLALAGTVTFSVPTIDITPAQAAAGVTGYFDVTVSETGGPDKLYQFNADVFLNPLTSGVNFTPYAGDGSIIGQTAGADYHASVPYIYTAAFSVDLQEQAPAFTDSFDPANHNFSEANASDEPESSGGATTLSSTFGLMRIEYTIPAHTAAGTYPILFNSAADFSGSYAETTSLLTTNYFLPNFVNGALVVTQENCKVEF